MGLQADIQTFCHDTAAAGADSAAAVAVSRPALVEAESGLWLAQLESGLMPQQVGNG